MKNFLNYIFKRLSSLRRREFDEKNHRDLKKIGQRSCAPKLKERNSPAGGRSAGAKPASWRYSRIDLQFSLGG